jgi:hypothetical protein
MPSPLLMRVSEFPNVLEAKDAEETAVSALPAALNGKIEAAGDADSFRVKTKAGDRWRVRVFARSLGTPLDPRLTIRKVDAETDDITADDSVLTDRDLWAMSRQIQRKELMDPAVIWEPKDRWRLPHQHHRHARPRRSDFCLPHRGRTGA